MSYSPSVPSTALSLPVDHQFSLPAPLKADTGLFLGRNVAPSNASHQTGNMIPAMLISSLPGDASFPAYTRPPAFLLTPHVPLPRPASQDPNNLPRVTFKASSLPVSKPAPSHLLLPTLPSHLPTIVSSAPTLFTSPNATASLASAVSSSVPINSIKVPSVPTASPKI
jgi:hypothetical protein